jgi:hypothetical protein
MQVKDEQMGEMQATLAKNRDLILMLKDEYKRASDKVTAIDKER